MKVENEGKEDVVKGRERGSKEVKRGKKVEKGKRK